jgi:hypothetical protein
VVNQNGCGSGGEDVVMNSAVERVFQATLPELLGRASPRVFGKIVQRQYLGDV